VTYKPEFGAKGLAAARTIATQAREVFASDGGAGGYPNLDRMLANTSSKTSGDDDGAEATANRNKRAVEILGSENLKRLRDIKRRVDPKGVLKNWFGV
jgi:FAD/FMN-containing dehydrogenase